MVLVSYKPCSIYRTLQTNRTSFLGLQSSDDSSTLGGVTSLRGEESRMMTVECITALFYEVDEQLCAIPKHPAVYLMAADNCFSPKPDTIPPLHHHVRGLCHRFRRCFSISSRS